MMAIANASIRAPRVARDGLGFRVEPHEAPVSMTFSRIVERSSELTAEIHVQTRPGSDHVLRRRINLLGARAPADLAKDLDLATDSAGWPWRRIVESAFASVVESHRAGEGVKVLGGKATAPPAPSHLIAGGVLIKNTANTWFGPGGTGKSTAAVAACVAHTIGQPFAGLETEQGVALYLDWEDEDEAMERLLWEVSRGYDLDQSARLHWRRMKAPLAGEIAFVSALIDRIGATLVVIDSATRAMGAAGEHGTYESTAVAFAEAIRALGKVTILIIDHVDGATVKEGAIAKKSYGSIHKMNFVRNAWSLTPDDEASEQTVGWTHAKVNYIRKRPPFGIRYQRDEIVGGLRLIPMAEADVGVMAKAMPQWKQLASLLERTGPLDIKSAALELLGRDDDKACSQTRVIFSRDRGAHMVRLPDGRISARFTPMPVSDGTPFRTPGRPKLSMLGGVTSPESEASNEVPF